MTATVDARVVRTRNDVLGAALRVLVERGRDAVTHPAVARSAGYSRATVYKHWPSREVLVQEALLRVRGHPHHSPTGELRGDLVGELCALRAGAQLQRTDRALAALADLAPAAPALAAVRDRLAADGERGVRELLAPVLDGPALDAATAMLCGAVLHGALAQDRPLADDVVVAAVDLLLRGLPAAR